MEILWKTVAVNSTSNSILENFRDDSQFENRKTLQDKEISEFVVAWKKAYLAKNQ
jgi:hypothetical protein